VFLPGLMVALEEKPARAAAAVLVGALHGPGIAMGVVHR
jgi:hypothetical protein